MSTRPGEGIGGAEPLLDVGPEADRAALEAMRQVVLLVNDLGLAVTRAIAEAGLGEFVSNADAIVLTTLYFDGPCRPTALIGPTRMTSAGVTGVMNRLEDDGLLTREYGAVPGDRRGAVRLTPAGEARVLTLSQVVEQALTAQQSLLDELAKRLGLVGAAPIPDVRATVSPLDRLEALGRMGAAVIDALTVGHDRDDPHRLRSIVVLAYAAERRGTRPRDILQHTTLSSSGVSQLVERLERAGLVRGIRGESTDQRAVTVKLTPRGRRNLDASLRAVLAHVDAIRLAFADAVVPTGV